MIAKGNRQNFVTYVCKNYRLTGSHEPIRLLDDLWNEVLSSRYYRVLTSGIPSAAENPLAFGKISGTADGMRIASISSQARLSMEVVHHGEETESKFSLPMWLRQSIPGLLR
jgi:hypothetical protein